MPELTSEAMAVSVSDAVALAKASVKAVPRLTVTGEVSGFRGPNARSGHCYFQIKDDQAAIDAIVWRGVYAKSGLDLHDGLEVMLTGSFDIYERTGRLSFVATKLEVSGEGILRQRVAQLAKRLAAEGLMDDARKRQIPVFCTRVAVVTSLSGSVIDDVKRTLARRNPLVELDVVGCKVQGEGAEATIMRALEVAAATQPDCILLVRGGGSFEDLMTFNDEALARAVASCPVPVVCGIGHEPDTSICDMVADRRCSTPTAAAESVAPAIDELARNNADRQARLGRAMSTTIEAHLTHTADTSSRMARALTSRLTTARVRVDALASHRVLNDPTAMLDLRTQTLERMADDLADAMPKTLAVKKKDTEQLSARLCSAAGRIIPAHRSHLKAQERALEALSPVRVLERGYAITTDGAGHVISSADKVGVGDEIHLQLAHGTLGAAVSSVEHEPKDQPNMAD